MNKKKRIIIVVTIVLLLIVGIISVYFYIKNKQKTDAPVKTIEVLDSIQGYDYKLEDRDTQLYKDKFLELKKELESETIDQEKYASILAELFAIDLYTIDNKNSKYDVGALDFIYPEEQEKFKAKVTDTIYKLVEDNSDNSRKQDLPVVSKTEITKIEETEYSKGENTFTGFKIYLSINYEEDLGYDNKIIITIIKENEKMYVVSISSEEI